MRPENPGPDHSSFNNLRALEILCPVEKQPFLERAQILDPEWIVMTRVRCSPGLLIILRDSSRFSDQLWCSPFCLSFFFFSFSSFFYFTVGGSMQLFFSLLLGIISLSQLFVLIIHLSSPSQFFVLVSWDKGQALQNSTWRTYHPTWSTCIPHSDCSSLQSDFNSLHRGYNVPHR